MEELGWICEHLGKGSDACVKSFHEKVLDCYDAVAENMLVDVCLHEVVEDYLTYLENVSFSSFSRLVEPQSEPMNLS